MDTIVRNEFGEYVVVEDGYNDNDGVSELFDWLEDEFGVYDIDA